jgi:predicted phosphoribosyltransferase/dienelactone hydrolase
MSRQPTQRRTGAVTSLEDPPLLSPEGMVFRDRHDAGRRLAERLEPFRAEHPVVVGIPRGGVPVAAEVARALGAPLDVAVVRKIGAPQNPEFAMGALAEGGVHVLSANVVRAAGLSDAGLRALIEGVERELAERIALYRGSRDPVEIAGRTVILVDDGLATGRSALAAVISLRKRGAARVILAVPVAAPSSVEALRAEADEVVCVEMPDDLWAVGLWYEDFSPTSDEEVAALLAEAAASQVADASEPVVRQVEIAIPSGVCLQGELSVPQPAQGVVAFAHGSGSSRLSPRNRAVARALNEAGFATLLFDLLTSEEERDRTNVFDIGLLASRLAHASAWMGEQDDVATLPLGYFGASTGAAAALTAAGELGERVGAVVSRGGRPDLAHNLGAVRAPTLLIVGGADREVLELNRDARAQLLCPSELAVIPGATHLFEEPGALEHVCRLAVDWFDRHLA